MRTRAHFWCVLFGHKAKREPIWNDGFYFAACSRCDADIVRIPGESWHTPLHAHVVWSKAAPPSTQQARAKLLGKGPLQAFSELPAHTRIVGSAAHEIRRGTQTGTAATEQRRSSIPDFMDDAECPIDAFSDRRPLRPPADPRPMPARPVRVA